MSNNTVHQDKDYHKGEGSAHNKLPFISCELFPTASTVSAARIAMKGAKTLSHTIALTGQSLIRRDLRSYEEPGFFHVKDIISSSSHTFTNFEACVYGKYGGARQKDEFFHGTDPSVLDALREIGFDILSLSNNHAFDLGAEGILSTLDEVTRRGFAHAGTGRDLSHASLPGYSCDGELHIVLVAWILVRSQMESMLVTLGSVGRQDPA